MTIYVEGLCRNNGTKFAKAGYALVFGLQDPRNISVRLDGVQSTQRADITAITHLVTILARDQSSSAKTFMVATHSKWLVATVNENLDLWKRAGWTNANREKVENLDLLLQLDKCLTVLGQQGKSIQMEFVRMQEASPPHVLADKLANQGCDMQSQVVSAQLSPPQSPQERRRRSSSGFPPQQQSPQQHHQNQYGGYPGPGFHQQQQGYYNSPQQMQQGYYNSPQQMQQGYYQGGYQEQGYPSPQWQQQQHQQQQQGYYQ